MLYKLKKNSPEFNCVDGPLAGQEFRHGKVYEEIPEGDRHRFETVTAPPPANPVPKPAAKKKGASEGNVGAKDLSPTKGGDDK